jgi:hypothetical protein
MYGPIGGRRPKNTSKMCNILALVSFITFIALVIFVAVYVPVVVLKSSPSSPPVILISQVQVSFYGNLSSVADTTAYANTLATQIALGMGILASQVTVVALRSGSIIADVQFADVNAPAVAATFITQTATANSAVLVSLASAQSTLGAIISPAVAVATPTPCSATLCGSITTWTPFLQNTCSVMYCVY